MGADIAGFAIFALAMVGTPGPANMVLLAAGARFGFRAAMPFVGGIILGKQLVIWPIGFGLMTLADSVPGLFLTLKWISVAYVLWLAWRIASARIASREAAEAAPGFCAGLIVHPLNPKAWAMITAGFTNFVDAGAPVLPATIAIAAVLFATQCILHPFWCLGGQHIAAVIAGRPGERYLMWVLAALTVLSVAWAVGKEAL